MRKEVIIMPSALLYLGIMLVVIVIWFVLLKRPVYEAVLISFIILLTIQQYKNRKNYIKKKNLLLM